VASWVETEARRLCGCEECGGEGRMGECARVCYEVGMRAALEKAAEVAEQWAEHYPADVFPPPAGKSSAPEQYSGTMARHTSRVIAEAIRALLTE